MAALVVALFLSVGVTNAHATTYHGAFSCNGTWVPVANEPSKYIIGNCPGGTSFLRTDKAFGDVNWYDGGFIADSRFNGCGWIDTSESTQYDASYQATGCAPGTVSKNPREFMWAANCQPGTCSDGTYVTVPAGKTCMIVANVRPWGSSLAPTDVIRYRGAGYTGLKWRYIVGQNGAPKADPYGNYWVMVRDSDPSIPLSQGRWGFVPTSCLPATLPPAPSGYYFP